MAAHHLPSPAVVRRALLDDLRFEDDQYLWEVVWTLNAHSPDVPQSLKVELARAAVFGLLEDGEIELRKIMWPESSDGQAGPSEPLSPEQVERLRSDDLPWFDPTNSTDLLVRVAWRRA